jgi:hypothetical protein
MMGGSQSKESEDRRNLATTSPLGREPSFEGSQVPPLLIPTRDLLRDKGNYAIARKMKNNPRR